MKRRWSYEWWKRNNKRHPQDGVVTGDRFVVWGTVGEVKRLLDGAGIRYKKVRICGRYPGCVEIFYTTYMRYLDTPNYFFREHYPSMVHHSDSGWAGGILGRR